MGSRRQIERALGELGELLEAREGVSLDIFSEYAGEPTRFAREVLDGDPWSAQTELLEATVDHDQVVMQGANGTGKDWATAVAALYWVCVHQGLVLVTAATERQARDVWMAEFSRLWRRADVDLPGELYAGSLKVPGTPAGVFTFTSTSASKLSGFHSDRVLAIVSEAQEVEPFGWEGLQACAVGPKDRLVATGNPVKPTGKFFEAARSAEWHTIQVSIFDHPNLDPQSDRHISGGPSRSFARRIAREWGGEGSPIYRARVLGQFPEEGEGSLVRRSWLDAAAERHERWTELARANRHPITIGVDVARYGPDATVACLRQGDAIREFRAWSGADTRETARRVRQLQWEVGRLTPDKRVRTYVDAIGTGAGVVDALREMDADVTEYKGSRSPLKGTRFENARAESYWAVRRALEEGELALPADEALFEELLGTIWEPTGGGKVKIAAKSGMKGRLGRSPDRADALAMTFAPRREARGIDGPSLVGIRLR